MKAVLKTNIPNVGVVGQIVDLSPDAFRVYVALGRAERYSKPKPERAYRRRDMAPQPADPAPITAPPDTVDEPESVEISSRTGLPKRQYRRRDLGSTE